jgi:hypothetical protein
MDTRTRPKRGNIPGGKKHSVGKLSRLETLVENMGFIKENQKGEFIIVEKCPS